ncbi:hypothetical protein MBLNU459_g0299t1 [Dothideomycetes sp. NU459]
MSANEKTVPTIVVTSRPRAVSQDSHASSLKTPRVARFAEATAVNSPIEPKSFNKYPPKNVETNHYTPQPQPSDIGFGFMNDKHASHVTVEMEEADNHLPHAAITPASPLMSPPLKSAMKTPGHAPRNFGNILSPTFHEEEALEKQEALTEIEQAKDLKIKTRVRVAKIFLRGVNFSCSLIVLSMLSTTFSIFNATKAIPPRNNLPPWAIGTNPWPQIVLLVISVISLTLSMVIMYAYWKGGHNRAQKAAVYYTVFAVGFFIFSIIMWGVGAGILQGAKAKSNGQDLWGWSCKENKRQQLFQADVSYNMICRLQNWSLLCAVIEIVVETITIAIYGIMFYRFYSKHRLRKSMAVRDRARSDVYLAHLRSQSAPNTPGLNGPLSARDGGWKAPVDYYSAAPEVEDGVQYVEPAKQAPQPKPFVLQPPPVKVQGATPKMQQAGFTPIARSETPVSRSPSPPEPAYQQQKQQRHFGAAPGEKVYDAVPIPGSYVAPLGSPTVAPRQMTYPSIHR